MYHYQLTCTTVSSYAKNVHELWPTNNYYHQFQQHCVLNWLQLLLTSTKN